MTRLNKKGEAKANYVALVNKMSENKENTYIKNIKENMKKYKKTYITLDKLIEFAANNYEINKNEILMDNIEVFTKVISGFQSERIIEPTKGSINDRLMSQLNTKYIVIKNTVKEDKSEIAIDISKVHGDIKVDYYIKHPQKYKEDREIIKKISEYMYTYKPYMSANELAFKLFNDEKFFENPKKKENRGLNILSNLGITYDTLNVYRSVEPFFYFRKEIGKKIIIIENKDTFWSFYKAFFKTNKEVKMLIFGEGYKITSSFSLASDFYINKEDEILYFGDVDADGFFIYKTLVERYPDYNIKLYKEAYEKLLDTVVGVLPSSQNIVKKSTLEEALDFLCKNFLLEESYKERIITLLKNNNYVPQEGLNLPLIERMANDAN